MKVCDSIRSILLTDYLDGELDYEIKKDIEAHLAGCHECARILAAVKEEMSVISGGNVRKKAPAHLWGAILKRLENENRPLNKIRDAIANIAERFMLPRLAPVLAGIALLFLSASFFLYTQHIRQNYGNESLRVASELFAGEGASSVGESEGLGTPIEEYFL